MFNDSIFNQNVHTNMLIDKMDGHLIVAFSPTPSRGPAGEELNFTYRYAANCASSVPLFHFSLSLAEFANKARAQRDSDYSTENCTVATIRKRKIEKTMNYKNFKHNEKL